MRITDLPVLYTASLEDVLYIIDRSDTTDFLSGSSKQITLSNFFTSSGIFGGIPSSGGAITGFTILSDKIISDGITTVYTISSSVSDQSKDIFLFVNGVNQAPDINYTLTSSVLTLFGAPFSGSEIEIRRFEISSSLFIGISSQKFISDGLTENYAITSSANDTAKDIFLFINGVNQTPDVNYTLLNSNLTLFGAPFSGSEIEIRKFNLSAVSGGGGTTLTTGSTYPITSSWSINSISSSYSINAGLLNNTSSNTFATTGSNNFNGTQTVQGDIRVIGNLIAQQYVVSSSVSYFTSSNFDGSTKFGDSALDTHQFTGSLLSPNITGSLFGTSSFSLSASYVSIKTINWTGSNFVSNITTQSIPAFNQSGSPVLVTPTSDNVYLVMQNGILKWIPIASVAVSILNNAFSENDYIVDGLYNSAIISVAFVSSFTSGSI